MATADKKLQCVVVTPEKTVLEREADFLVVPLFDGELGILKDRAPLIARLGYGELRCRSAGMTERYYVDGGFVQVRDNVISVLTSRAIPAAEIDLEQADEQLQTALGQVPTSDEGFAAKEQALARARAQIALVRKSSHTP